MSCKETFDIGIGYIAYAFNRVYEINEYVESENAKLRELAKQMHICLTRPKVYDGKQPYLTATECPYFTEGACDYNACGFERRLRELGIGGGRMYGTAVNDMHPILTMRERLQNLADENAKLRELVRDMLPFAKDSLEIDCPMERCWLYEEGECNKPFVVCRVGELTCKRVRDLGIEDG